MFRRHEPRLYRDFKKAADELLASAEARNSGTEWSPSENPVEAVGVYKAAMQRVIFQFRRRRGDLAHFAINEDGLRVAALLYVACQTGWPVGVLAEVRWRQYEAERAQLEAERAERLQQSDADRIRVRSEGRKQRYLIEDLVGRG